MYNDRAPSNPPQLQKTVDLNNALQKVEDAVTRFSSPVELMRDESNRQILNLIDRLPEIIRDDKIEEAKNVKGWKKLFTSQNIKIDEVVHPEAIEKKFSGLSEEEINNRCEEMSFRGLLVTHSEYVGKGFDILGGYSLTDKGKVILKSLKDQGLIEEQI